MDKLTSFSRTNNFGIVNLKEIKDDNCSIGGNIKKWIFVKDDYRYYVKTFSNNPSGFPCYECENECFAYELFDRLGIPSIKYVLDEIEYDGKTYKVCISKDFAHECEQDCLFECIPGIADVRGKDRYNLLLKFLPQIREQLDKILIGDFIINNRDRHLHNLEVVTNASGEIYLPNYDNGSSLYHDVRDKSLHLFYNISWSTCPCRPFYDSWGDQLNLIDLSRYSLKNIDDKTISQLLNKYYSPKRSNMLQKLIATRLKVLKEKGVKFYD